MTDSLEGITRRDFLRIGSRLGLVFGGTAFFNYSAMDQSELLSAFDQRMKQEREDYKKTGDLTVPYFLPSMTGRVLELEPLDSPITQLLKLGTSYLFGDLAAERLQRKQKTKAKIITGLTTGGIANTIDLKSTYDFFELAKDKRFKEYGIDSILYESNPLITDLGFTLGVAVKTITGAIFAAIFPQSGSGYLAVSPFVYTSNQQKTRLLNLFYEIGDGVKNLIDRKVSPSDIQNYIKKAEFK